MKPMYRSFGGALLAIGLITGALSATISSVGGAATVDLLKTTTTVTETAGTITDQNQPVSFTAAVELADVHGLLVTPSGPVSFTAVNGTNTLNLGSPSLSRCLLTLKAIGSLTTATCHATVTSKAFTVDGVWKVTANYSGSTDLVAGPSHNSITLNVIPGVSSSCLPLTDCSNSLSNGDGSAEISITMYNSTNSTQYVYLAFGYPEMNDCSNGPGYVEGNDTTSPLNYPLSGPSDDQNGLADSTGPDGIDVTYQLTNVSQAGYDQNNDGDPYGLCWGASQDFQTEYGPDAQHNSANHDFEGSPPQCDFIHDGYDPKFVPCTDNEYSYGYGDYWSEDILAAGGIDPGIGHQLLPKIAL